MLRLGIMFLAFGIIAGIQSKEANCATSDADSLHIQYSTSLESSIDAGGEIDVYTFTGTAGDRIIVRMLAQTSSLDSWLGLYGPGDTLLDSHYDPWQPGGNIYQAYLYDYELKENGIYKIYCSDVGGDATGDYLLSLQCWQHLKLNGQPITYDTAIDTNISVFGQYCAYTFTGAAGERIIVRMLAQTSTLDSELLLYGPGDTLLAGHSDPWNPGGYIYQAYLYDYELPENGTYTIYCSDVEDDATGDYLLSLQCWQHLKLNGQPITYDTAIDTNISVFGQYCAYTFTGAAGERIIVRMLAQTSTLDSELLLYGPGDTLLAGHSDPWRPGGNIYQAYLYDYELPENGTYTIYCSDVEDDATGSYWLSLQCREEALSRAYPLPDRDGTLIGTLEQYGDLNAYLILIDKYDTTSIIVTSQNGGVQPVLELFDSQDSLLITLSGGSVALSDEHFVASGYYLLYVSDGGGDQFDDYHMTWSGILRPKAVNILSERLSAILTDEYYSHQFEAVGGTSPYTWEYVSGNLPSGLSFYSGGILSGTPGESGSFEFTISATDVSDSAAARQFTLDVYDEYPPPEIVLNKWGTTAVPGRVLTFYISVQNVSNIPGQDLEVLELLNPDHFELRSLDPPGIVGADTLAEASVAMWIIDLAPFETIVLNYKAKLKNTVPTGIEITGGPVYVGEDLFLSWLQCLHDALSTVMNCGPCVTCLWGCSSCTFLPACITCASYCGALCVGNPLPGGSSCIGSAWDAVTSCQDFIGNYIVKEWRKLMTTFPRDPNEKGALADTYIQSWHPLPYAVHFENVGDVEALDVFITDTLDANLDISTVEILTPGGELDTVNRVISWDLLGINLQPGETDAVLFTVNPVNGLQSGTEIPNSATIQFEIFDIIITNEVVNIIDDEPPVGIMNPLPAMMETDTFTISWTGADVIGEVDHFSIYVSEDGGEFTELIRNTSDTTYLFAGEINKLYGFICVAVDVATNIEEQEFVAEVQTMISEDTGILEEESGSLPTNFALSQNYPNPFNAHTTIEYALPRSAHVEITVHNVLGERVRTLVNQIQQAGYHSIRWDGKNEYTKIVASGIYFYKLKAGDFETSKTMTLMK
ncbi:putative Ig domain-containing protein [Candidatus Zixiibacteriota bacterium]